MGVRVGLVTLRRAQDERGAGGQFAREPGDFGRGSSAGVGKSAVTVSCIDLASWVVRI